MTELRKNLLKRINEAVDLEYRSLTGEEVGKKQLVESNSIFEKLTLSDFVSYPSVIIKNEICAGRKDLNESVKVITESYLEKKNKDYITFLQIEGTKIERNYIIQDVPYSEAVRMCDVLGKEEFFLLREKYVYKIAFNEGKFSPVLQDKMENIFKEAPEDSDKYYQIFNKKFKALFSK